MRGRHCVALMRHNIGTCHLHTMHGGTSEGKSCCCVIQVTLVLPSIQRAFGMGGLYLGFGCVAAVSWVVIFFIVPETKGRTLEEIEELLRQTQRRPALGKLSMAEDGEEA